MSEADQDFGAFIQDFVQDSSAKVHPMLLGDLTVLDFVPHRTVLLGCFLHEDILPYSGPKYMLFYIKSDSFFTRPHQRVVRPSSWPLRPVASLPPRRASLIEPRPHPNPSTCPCC